MSGTKEGGQKTAVTNKVKYGPDFYAKIGAMGGKNGKTGGFAYWQKIGREDLIAEAGRKGGYASTRKGIKNAEVQP